MNKNNMKICHMTSVHNTDDIRIFKKECVSLTKAGYDVYLVGPGNDRIEDGVSIIGAGEKPASKVKRMLSFSKIVFERSLEVNADVYHFHDPELLRYALKLKKLGKKVIFDCHENTKDEIMEKVWIPVFLRKLISIKYGKLQNKVLERIDGAISVTPNICEDLSMKNDNICMITNYPIIAELPTIKKTNSKEFTMVFAGGIKEEWNHEMIVDALGEIDNIKFELYGNGEISYFNKLRSYKGWGKTNYHGKVPHKEVEEALASADIGVALINYNLNCDGNNGTLGNTKLFECMCFGIPVICTDFKLWKKIIEDNKCGICINPNDKRMLIDAIKYLQENREEAYEMGINGRKLIEKEYNWNTQEIKLLSFYDSL